MALPTGWVQHANVIGGGSSSTHTTVDFTPGAFSLILSCWAGRRGTDWSQAVTTPLGMSSTWTEYAQTKTSSPFWKVAIIAAITNGTPGTGALTLTTSAVPPATGTLSLFDWGWQVFEVPAGQFDPLTPIAQSIGAETSAATISLTFPTTPAASSTLFGFISSAGTGAVATPGGSAVEMLEQQGYATNGGMNQSQYSTGEASMSWADLNRSTNSAIAVEIKAAPPRKRRRRIVII